MGWWCVFSVLMMFAVATLAGTDNVDYSWRMLGGNLQRNGRAEWQTTTLQKPNMTWAFFALDLGDAFMHSPVYSYPDNAVYSITGGGFVYAVDGTSGQMLWSTCVGTPPVFPSDPCTDIKYLDLLPYGQPTLLDSGDVIVLVQNDVEDGADKMIRISKKDGSIVWTLQLFVSDVDSSFNDHFYSLPTVLPCNSTDLEGSECLLLWVTKNSSFVVYTIVSADTGKIVHERYYRGGRAKWVTPPMVVDPVDGNVISQYVDIDEETCGEDFDQQYRCLGIGKFDTWTGEKIWNQTMEESWSNGMMAIDNGTVHAGSDQLYAYSYNTKDGSIRWKVLESTSSFNMYYAGVCTDGTVVYPDNGQYMQAWTPEPSRKKRPVFWEASNGPCAVIPTMTNDNTFYMQEDNDVYAHSCKDGSVLWGLDFGESAGFECSIAITKDAIFANVYQEGNSGAIVKLQDP